MPWWSGAAVTPTLSFDVHWRVPVGCGFSGFFTEVVLGYLPALHALGINARLLSGRCDDRWLSSHLEAHDAAVVRAAWLDEASLTASQTRAALAIEHGEPCGMRHWSPHGRPWRVIARAMSEGDLSPSNARCLAGADEVWVPTQWHVERFVAAGVRHSSLFVMPEAVDTTFFSPEHPTAVSARASRGASPPFVFVSVFKWEHRKGWDLLLDAYWKEFAPEVASGRHVLLRLKTYLPSWEAGPRDLNDHLEMHARSHHTRRSALPPVELLLDDASREGMRAMYAGSDAFVLPTRGEGWGLPICEAMAMGLPAIATNFSGPTAFLTRANSHPLPVHRALPGGFAEPSVEALRRAMRAAFSERGTISGFERGKAARADMVKRFSRDAVGKLLLARLQALSSVVEKHSGARGKRGGGYAGGNAGAGGTRRSGRQKKEELRVR